MIHIHELQRIIHDDVNAIKANAPAENIDLLDAVGRVLASNIVSPLNIPPASVSAMDGYGFFMTDDECQANTSLMCVGEAIAGKAFAGEIEAGQCVRIMTGAVVPEGVNTVIMQEQVERNDDIITLKKSIKQSSNIRQCGEEISDGDIVFIMGKVVGANDIPLLASLGCKTVSVYPKLRVGVFSTGDELCELGETLTHGKIYDANRPTIKALLQSHPVTINDYGIVPDDLSAIKETLAKAASENDFVVTSGGVSVGDYDFLKDAVSELGDIVQYKVAMKPGKPFVYGRLGEARYFGLPGNPLSTAISARLFLLPAIYQCISDAPVPLLFQGTLKNAINRKAGRAELQRGFAEQTADGKWLVSTNVPQDSHRVYQLSRANVLVFLSAEQTDMTKGDTVNLLPIDKKFL